MRREGDTELTDRRTTDNGSHSLQGSPLWTSSSFALRPGLKAKVIEDTGNWYACACRCRVTPAPAPALLSCLLTHFVCPATREVAGKKPSTRTPTPTPHVHACAVKKWYPMVCCRPSVARPVPRPLQNCVPRQAEGPRKEKRGQGR